MSSFPLISGKTHIYISTKSTQTGQLSKPQLMLLVGNIGWFSVETMGYLTQGGAKSSQRGQ